MKYFLVVFAKFTRCQAISNASTGKDNVEIVSCSNIRVFSSIFYPLSGCSEIKLILPHTNGDLLEFTNNSFAKEERKMKEKTTE